MEEKSVHRVPTTVGLFVGGETAQDYCIESETVASDMISSLVFAWLFLLQLPLYHFLWSGRVRMFSFGNFGSVNTV